MISSPRQSHAISFSPQRASRGILANHTYPADFLYDKVAIESTVIHSVYRQRVKKLLFLGSTRIYPRFAPQLLPQEGLLTSPLEPTNAWHTVAKIAGIKLWQAYCRQHGCNFILATPTNPCGPGDNYDLD